MPSWRVIAIGRAGRSPEADLFERYANRMRPRLGLVEIPDGKGSPAEIKRREAQSILAALDSRDFAIALDLGGHAPDSLGLATLLTTWSAQNRPLTFVLGGAEGLDATVLARANHTLSLGPLTWPHLLARVLLAEQLFRAQSIAAGHPYHRAGRPD